MVDVLLFNLKLIIHDKPVSIIELRARSFMSARPNTKRLKFNLRLRLGLRLRLRLRLGRIICSTPEHQLQYVKCKIHEWLNFASLDLSLHTGLSIDALEREGAAAHPACIRTSGEGTRW